MGGDFFFKFLKRGDFVNEFGKPWSTTTYNYDVQSINTINVLFCLWMFSALLNFAIHKNKKAKKLKRNTILVTYSLLCFTLPLISILITHSIMFVDVRHARRPPLRKTNRLCKFILLHINNAHIRAPVAQATPLVWAAAFATSQREVCEGHEHPCARHHGVLRWFQPSFRAGAVLTTWPHSSWWRATRRARKRGGKAWKWIYTRWRVGLPWLSFTLLRFWRDRCAISTRRTRARTFQQKSANLWNEQESGQDSHARGGQFCHVLARNDNARAVGRPEGKYAIQFEKRGVRRCLERFALFSRRFLRKLVENPHFFTVKKANRWKKIACK